MYYAAEGYFQEYHIGEYQIEHSLLYPVTIRCNVTNPCEAINFINARTDRWDIGQKEDGHVCEYASGIGEGNVPVIDCLTERRSSGKDQNIVVGKDVYNNRKNKSNLKHENNDITWKDYLRLLAQM